jgi:hypothetical protein
MVKPLDHATSLEVIAWFVIVPFCFASFLSGLIQALGTQWGLFKLWWILKLILTVIATLILMLHMQPISLLGEAATQKNVVFEELRAIRIRIIADAGADDTIFFQISPHLLSKYETNLLFSRLLRKSDY